MDHSEYTHLVLARGTKPIPEGVNVAGAAKQWLDLEEEGKADAYRIVEDNGYGFAVFIDATDHDELMKILFRNPIGRWGEYEVYPLGTVHGENVAMREAGIIGEVN